MVRIVTRQQNYFLSLYVNALLPGKNRRFSLRYSVSCTYDYLSDVFVHDYFGRPAARKFLGNL